jgi:hypothetical protein
MNWSEALQALLGKGLRAKFPAVQRGRWRVIRTRVMVGDQRLFDELLVHTRHSLRMNRPGHLT